MADSFPGPWKLGPRSGVNGMALSLDLYLGATWESLKFLLEANFVSCDKVIQSLRSLPLLCDVACRLPRLGSCALWKVGYGRVVISCFLMCCFSCHLGRIRWYLLDWEILYGFQCHFCQGLCAEYGFVTLCKHLLKLWFHPRNDKMILPNLYFVLMLSRKLFDDPSPGGTQTAMNLDRI